MGKFEIEIKWGIIFSFAVLAWSFLEKSIGLYDDAISNYALFTNLFGFIAILVYVLALREKKIEYFNRDMNWKQGFVAGVFLTVVVTVFTPLCQFIIHRFIAPEFLPNLIRYKVESRYLTREAAESYFNLETYIYQNSSFALSMGIVTSAVVAYFLQTKTKKS